MGSYGSRSYGPYLLAITFLAAFITKAASETFDYVIVGGGTAGLAIAARLTEDPNITVAVIEAGLDLSKDVNVLAPGLLTALYGNSTYDWNYHTVPQTFASGQVVAHPRGKQLGGSSAINWMFWTHAGQKDIDNWGALGNAGWSWEALLPYYRRSEHSVGPSALTAADLETQYIIPELHGANGAIYASFPDFYGPLDEAWPRTYDSLGLGLHSDPRDGLALGGYTNLIGVKPDDHTRSYSATGYLAPALGRSNLKVIVDALAQLIVFEDIAGMPTARAVKYTKDGLLNEVYAEGEVILCAGSFGSPQLLELSGIGDAALLTELKISSLVNNPNVGENLQDHIYVPVAYDVVPGIFTLDDLANETIFDAAYEEYLTNSSGILSTPGASSALLSLDQVLEGAEPHFKSCPEDYNLTAGLTAQYELIWDDLFNSTEAITQELSIVGGMNPVFVNDTTQLFFASTPGNFFTLLGVLEHPFSRGSVHITSANVSVYPTIDPRYLSHPLDLEVLSKIALHLQKVAEAEPLRSLLQDNGTIYQPGYYELDESNVGDWIKQNLQSEYHPSGSCAMLPKDKGGVVDSKFKVYGTSGLRIVDASVFPILPRANLQTLVYAIAERAVDFIKEDM